MGGLLGFILGGAVYALIGTDYLLGLALLITVITIIWFMSPLRLIGVGSINPIILILLLTVWTLWVGIKYLSKQFTEHPILSVSVVGIIILISVFIYTRRD